MKDEIEKYEFTDNERTICDLNNYIDYTVGAAGDGGAHYVDFRWWLFLMIGDYEWRQYDDFRATTNIYELIHICVHNDDTYDTAKHCIQEFEQGIYKNHGRFGGTNHCIFNYDPITGQKIDWKTIISELTTVIWYAKFDDEHKNKDINNKNE